MGKIAIYPGSFDPITNGHIDIIERASKVFDNIIVAVAHESGKASLFSVPERKKLIDQVNWQKVLEVWVHLFSFCWN